MTNLTEKARQEIKKYKQIFRSLKQRGDIPAGVVGFDINAKELAASLNISSQNVKSAADAMHQEMGPDDMKIEGPPSELGSTLTISYKI